ncbi:MAG TPA: hypothetical protein VMH91_02000 [Candidatus Paceibacterota bacterium]|nr:hypothetical protein [Candidatus Paceibacterota bacterium]
MQLIVSGGCTPKQYSDFFRREENPVTEIIVMPPANEEHAARIREGIRIARHSGLRIVFHPGANCYK